MESEKNNLVAPEVPQLEALDPASMALIRALIHGKHEDFQKYIPPEPKIRSAKEPHPLDVE